MDSYVICIYDIKWLSYLIYYIFNSPFINITNYKLFSDKKVKEPVKNWEAETSDVILMIEKKMSERKEIGTEV
jgi:hypothetical protein